VSGHSPEEGAPKTVASNEAGERLDALIAEVAGSHEPVVIAGASGNAVLIGEDDWLAIRETLHLVSVPGLHDSIREGLRVPVDECHSEPDW